MYWGKGNEYQTTYTVGMVKNEADCIFDVLMKNLNSNKLSKRDACIIDDFLSNLEEALKK